MAHPSRGSSTSSGRVPPHPPGSTLDRLARDYGTVYHSTEEAELDQRRYLCCSEEPPQDFQVDLCPRTWFNLTQSNGFCHGLWKLTFMLFCIPCCYPCYLTRQCRRRAKRVQGGENFQRAELGSTIPRSSQRHGSPEKIVVTKANKIDASPTNSS
ncbi:uncharacterized protein LOC131884583 [Tigriopus californicus]|uniref:uncharacterized protein LOC131884583 n=1 Tax=Tigriopus californicus TaxID=6832 RepID=UPI0027DA4B29|nr:uncharacterized protein LOC131884583 [Tigriopus californicus]|eukprot:TCALIF_10069-PA protein Name:"Protein of unknown function" AED:0.00 eAED:0.00 QI:368/1/1/1/1/1/2/175/154